MIVTAHHHFIALTNTFTITLFLGGKKDKLASQRFLKDKHFQDKDHRAIQVKVDKGLREDLL